MESNHQELIFVPLFKDVNLMEKIILQIKVAQLILEPLSIKHFND